MDGRARDECGVIAMTHRTENLIFALAVAAALALLWYLETL